MFKDVKSVAQAGEGTLPRIHSRFLFLDLHPPLPASPLLHFYLLTVPTEYSPEQMSRAVVRVGINKVCVFLRTLTTLMNTMVAGLILEETGMEMSRPRVMKPQKRLGR